MPLTRPWDSAAPPTVREEEKIEIEFRVNGSSTPYEISIKGQDGNQVIRLPKDAAMKLKKAWEDA